MTQQDQIELPPLPAPDQYTWYSRNLVESIRRQAVAHDRQHRATFKNGFDFARSRNKLDKEDAEKYRELVKQRGEPVAEVQLHSHDASVTVIHPLVDFEPCDVGTKLYLAPQPAEPNEWKQAVDHELTNMQSTADSYPSAKDAVKALIDWHVAVATDPVFQQQDSTAAIALRMQKDEIETLREKLAEYEQQSGEAAYWVVPDFVGFLFPSEEAAQRYQNIVGDTRKPQPLYTASQPAEPLCEDEGCPHHGTKHVCVSQPAKHIPLGPQQHKSPEKFSMPAEPVKVPSDDVLRKIWVDVLRYARSGGGEGHFIDLMRSVLSEYIQLAPQPAEPVRVPSDGWKEAAIAWEVCASLHREYCKGTDPFFKTRQADFVKHAKDSRERCVNLCNMGEHACDDRSQCWERCGELGHSAEHAKVADIKINKE